MLPRVLFVSKPIAPPFHDGTKCLVRDVASHLERVRPVVLTTSAVTRVDGAPDGRVELVPVYPTTGAFSPKLTDNLRAAGYVLLRSRADVWHFVFAPNPRTSQVGRLLKRARAVPVLQTIASPPRSFDAISKLLFGDVIVAQSRWTRNQVEEAFKSQGARAPRLEVIPPPVPELAPRSNEATRALLARLGVPEGVPLFVYPGDLETSRGAEITAGICEELARAGSDAVVVFAYREKSARAPEIAARLERRLSGTRARFVSELPDVLELIQAATAVLFPVDDLWGKVDLPIVLLEAMALGVPVLALDHGPLADLRGAIKLASQEIAPWVDSALSLGRDPGARRDAVVQGLRAVEEHYAAPRVARAYEELYLELGRLS